MENSNLIRIPFERGKSFNFKKYNISTLDKMPNLHKSQIKNPTNLSLRCLPYTFAKR